MNWWSQLFFSEVYNLCSTLDFIEGEIPSIKKNTLWHHKIEPNPSPHKNTKIQKVYLIKTLNTLKLSDLIFKIPSKTF